MEKNVFLIFINYLDSDETVIVEIVGKSTQEVVELVVEEEDTIIVD
jgi:hypothetical protein